MLTPAQHDLLDCLMDIQTSGPSERHFGICDNVDGSHVMRCGCVTGVDEVHDALTDLFDSLGLDSCYPVGGGNYHHNRALYQNTVDMWDENTEYGRQRWALLDRCIKHLTELERQ